MPLFDKKKKYQKKVNKIIDKANRWSCGNAKLRGRIELRLIGGSWFRNSADGVYILNGVIRCFDKQTLQYKDYVYEFLSTHLSYCYSDFYTCIIKNFVEYELEIPNKRDIINNWYDINIPFPANNKYSFERLKKIYDDNN